MNLLKLFDNIREKLMNKRTDVSIDLTAKQRSWSQLKYQVSLETINTIPIMIIAFEGVYGFGSAGNSDAAFMEAVVEAVYKVNPSITATIFDLSKMSYEWGDAIDRAIGSYLSPIVVSALNVEGLTSLVEQEWLGDPKEWLFETLEIARSYLEQGFREQYFVKHYYPNRRVEIHLKTNQVSKIEHYNGNILHLVDHHLSNKIQRQIYAEDGKLEKEIEFDK